MARRNKNQRIYTILGAAVGTGLAVYGIRQGLKWYQQRQASNLYDAMPPDSSWAEDTRYQPTHQPDSELIPSTGVIAEAPPMTMTGMTQEERVNSDMVSDFDDRGTAFTTTEMTNTQTNEFARDEEVSDTVTGTGMYGGTMQTSGYSGTGETFTGTTTGMDMDSETTGQFRTDQESADKFQMNKDRLTADQYQMDRDRESVDKFQMNKDTEPVEQFGMGEDTSTTQRADIVMDEYVAPLIEHAIAFNSVMNLLRSRQRDGVGHEGTESLTEGDRHSMRAVLDQMQEKVTEYDEETLGRNPLAQRSYHITRRLRDALDNLDYTGMDLFRIQDELKPELCTLADELEASGQVTITGLDHIRQLYQC